MDPIGTVAFALHAVHTIAKIVDTVREAPEELSLLQAEASVVEECLGDLQLRLNGGDITSRMHREPRLRRLVDQAERLKTAADTFINKTTKLSADGQRRKIIKYKYLLCASDAKKLADRFRRFYTLYNTTYTTHISSTMNAQFTELQHQLEWTMQNNKQLVREVRRLISMVPTNPHLSGYSPRTHSESDSSGDETLPSSPRSSLSSPTLYESSQAFQHTAKLDAVDGQVCLPPRPVAPQGVYPWLGSLSVRSQPPPGLQRCGQCNKPSRKCGHSDVLVVEYNPPPWFAEIWAEVRCSTIPVHFSIRTPRQVDSLAWLCHATLEDVKMKLQSRELTVNDVEPNGFTVLHKMMFRAIADTSGASISILELLLDQSANTEWLLNRTLPHPFPSKNRTVKRKSVDMTPLEHALYTLYMWKQSKSFRASLEAFQSVLLARRFEQDLKDTWEDLANKLGWTDVHKYVCSLPSASESKDPFMSDLSTQVNSQDSLGQTPLYYAINQNPDLVGALLEAGADPNTDKSLLQRAVGAGADRVVGLLVRAGVDVNATGFRGSSALHQAAWCRGNSRFSVALALVRHASHMLNWDREIRTKRKLYSSLNCIAHVGCRKRLNTSHANMQ
ncbi:hypothetical protein NM688_g5807 [Phlebia brevispora]|uniref:Uncharacterized protein n=1 Tax=Phlebia brevispora TaxID=194682 RepID=A0ACC1SPJ7_9APHY|nr:hypothetical protein NM688_g5807 [Phlebia brevispora]